MDKKEGVKLCESCKGQSAKTLCPECYKCICDECNEYFHNKTTLKDHKTELIPDGIAIHAICSLHCDTLRMLCVDDAVLCCSTCTKENLHKNHRFIDISEIQKSNEIFSTPKVRTHFKDTLDWVDELAKRITATMDNSRREIDETREKVKHAFVEARKKLDEEEDQIMKELEERVGESEEILQNHLDKINEIYERSKILDKFDDETKGKCSRLMELNIVSDMEKHRRELETLCEEDMEELHTTWDDETRKLSFSKLLFNRGPAPKDVTFPIISRREIGISWECDENRVCEEDRDKIRYIVVMKKDADGDEKWKEVYSGRNKICIVKEFDMGTAYAVRVKSAIIGSIGKWSEKSVVKTVEIEPYGGAWKRCPDNIDEKRRYSVNADNSRNATRIFNIDNINLDDYKKMFGEDGKDLSGDEKKSRIEEYINKNYYCTIIGNTHLPVNKVISWNIKILKSRNNDGSGIFIGVAPFDINLNEDYNYIKCGWYLHCYESSLWSGPPHNYKWPGKKYGPRKGKGKYVHTGDTIGVVMDTTKGDLSFIVNGVNFGVAYEGIPLDKPLVPCVILQYGGDSVELDLSEMKENLGSSIPIPSNIKTKSDTWDSITLTWDGVEMASFYQIEVFGSKILNVLVTNSFTKRGFLPETDHSFRVRTVKGNSVSEWSDVVKGRTLKVPDFSEFVWKECPDDVDEKRKYSVYANYPRIVTNIGNDYCTIIGSAHLPLNKIISWSIKILKSKYGKGDGIYVGVAPFDINQNDDNNLKCGWYFNCYDLTLYPGPPHNYNLFDKLFGSREKEEKKHVHTGDIVSVVMDTTMVNFHFF